MEIVNIVATVTLDQPLDLNALQALLPGSKMPATRFPWLQYRLAPENFYIPFYRSGKFLITGIRSLGEIEPVADRVIALLNSAGLEVIATAITVHNIIAVDCLAAAIPMDRVFEALLSIGEWVEYEPEQFPGMIVKRDGASFLLFPTGKLVVTGVKDRERIVRAIEGLRSLISGIL
ncbi:MAG: hypothetical protein ABFC38_15105 [Methanospirillum sp.]